ncbi:hypothetical protein PSTH1771_25860 [Pseudomonas syringae pv. theae]|uniref:hypothetical protein n=1 Tax=Pseudomonas syringae TaxID=317 RepID=UPI0023BFA433|nr:hypothetical protein [Pseudomonas syringae]GKS08510.1 hypothetical protein PSTH1771_25860 [Pseudomonas syringae pv. theae]
MDIVNKIKPSMGISSATTKCKKQQISVTVQPELLTKLDDLASSLGQSRASMINIAIYNIIENGLEINKPKAATR